MIFQNAELHNVEKLIPTGDGGFTWLRIPEAVCNALERGEQGRNMAVNCTGVELRFVLKGDRAVLRMAAEGGGRFHVYRGGIQGAWMDHEVDKNIEATPRGYVIERAANAERLKRMDEAISSPWDSEVVRVIFDLGRIRLYGIEGDIRPPKPEECPPRTLLCYGSSITHGSNALDGSHSWAALLAHRLKMDLWNVAMAGSCAMEPEFTEWLAASGEQGRWDAAVLELGINVLGWPDEKIRRLAGRMIREVAGRNPDRQVFVISPFFCGSEALDGNPDPARWRRRLRALCQEAGCANVRYIDGLEILNGLEYMSADEVHPNIEGAARIADALTARLLPVIGK